MDIKTRKQLEKELQKRIKKVMNKQVKSMAKSTMQEKIVNEVYAKYQPDEDGYQRTYELLDAIETKPVDETTISIENTRHDGNRDVAKVIESGVGYDWEKSRIAQMQPFPRPFTEETRKSLENGKFKQTLKDGLQSEGLNIK
ncbi:hypothetical protein [Priestia megaterium]|uniref:hypothetical protein n=1 Tax=Priestia megaterium TaxID=1404 RepID=UPI003CC55C1B